MFYTNNPDDAVKPPRKLPEVRTKPYQFFMLIT